MSVDGFIELAEMVAKNELSSTAAKEVFLELLTSNEPPRAIAERKNLIQGKRQGEIAKIVDEVLADPASAQSVEDIKAGKDKAIGYLVGQIMKITGQSQSGARAKADQREDINVCLRRVSK